MYTHTHTIHMYTLYTYMCVCIHIYIYIHTHDICVCSRGYNTYHTSISMHTHDPIIPQKRLQTQEEAPRTQGETMCVVVCDACYRPVVLEYLVGFGVSSWECGDIIIPMPSMT